MATLAESRIVRGLLHFVLIFGLIQALIMGLSSAFGIVEATRHSSSGTVWVVLIAVCFGMVTTAVLMFEAAAARLSLVTENYARGPRIAFLIQFIGGALLFFWGWVTSGHDADVAVAGQVTCCAYLISVGLLVATDIDGMSRAHGTTKTAMLSLLRPGALRGYRLVLLCLLGATTLFGTMLLNSPDGKDTEVRVVAGAPLYAALILSASLLIPRLTRQPPFLMPALARIVAVVLFAFLSGLPSLFASLSGMEPDDAALNVLNPVVGLVNLGRSSVSDWAQVLVVAAVAGVLVLLTHASLERRDLQWGAH